MVVQGGQRERGFTLVELLVALSVFAVLMAAVTIIFVGSLRTTQVGYQQMKAYELARTALGVIEDDLVRGFSSTQHADVHGFYGTPIGMTFIGTVKATSEAKDRNLARVTYVLYNEETGPAFTEALEDTEKDNDGNIVHSADGFPVIVNRDAYQYALLRYVEPGVADLDSFPFNLDSPIAVQSEGLARTYRSILDVLCARARGWTSFDSTSTDLTKDEQNLVRAKTCEMWVRMLAGGDSLPEWADVMGEAGPRLPNFWTDIKYVDVEDYVVTKNILSIAPPDIRRVDPFGKDTPFLSFFDYDYAAQYLTTGSNPDQPNAKSRQSLWWNDKLAYNWDDPQLPEVVAVNFWLMFESPYPGAPDFQHRFVLEVNLPVAYTRASEE